MNHNLAPDSNIRHRPLLLEQISKHVSTFMEYNGMEITDTGVFCLDKNNEVQFVAGETVICALGQKPNKDLAEELRHTAPYTQIIGDANHVSTITNAIYQGYHTALDI